MKTPHGFFQTITTLFSVAVITGWAPQAVADISSFHNHQMPETTMPAFSGPMENRLAMPTMNPEKGKQLFVEKGCVACHSVNGVGGEDASSLDANTMDTTMNPFEFAARMWNHAGIMIPLQEEAIGEQITFTGDELADIIAFVHNDEVQHSFLDSDLSSKARQMMDHGHDEGSMGEMHGDEPDDGHEDDEDIHGTEPGHAD